MSERNPAVVVDHVQVAYRVAGRQSRKAKKAADSGRFVVAVDDVSFTAYEGQTVGVIGRNGSGKSSLLRAVAGLMPVRAGSIQVTDFPVLLGVGAALKGDLTGRENIVLGGTALGASRKSMLEQLDEIIEFAGIDKAIDRPFKTYSSGMKARLQFAVSTAVQPRILLVDEALAVGDEEFKDRSNERVSQLVDGASTVFLVSHSLSTIKRRCDVVLWIDAGRQVMWGDAGEVVTAYREDMVERRARRAAEAERRAAEKES
ncbi:MAG: ABC transporter ATP-binding protein [Acidimicrobiales bacterium]|nr:MAG: ABC transporter ATP-binding protein [Acidimicrobiales bacterium]